MAHGFEVRDPSGSLMLASNEITVRLVGHVTINSRTGSKSVAGITKSNSFAYLMGTGESAIFFANVSISLNNGSVSWSFDFDPNNEYYILIFRHTE